MGRARRRRGGEKDTKQDNDRPKLHTDEPVLQRGRAMHLRQIRGPPNKRHPLGFLIHIVYLAFMWTEAGPLFVQKQVDDGVWNASAPRKQLGPLS